MASARIAQTILVDGQLSLVTPAHNERDSIGWMIRESRSVLPALAPDFQIVVVDDGSTDGTAEVARAAMEGDGKRLRVVRHESKCGALVSVADGLRSAGGEYVAYIDGDGQFRVADLALLAREVAHADLVGGRRKTRADPWFRSIISGVFNLGVRLLYG